MYDYKGQAGPIGGMRNLWHVTARAGTTYGKLRHNHKTKRTTCGGSNNGIEAMRVYCKHVFVATGKLEGRAMMIWFKEGEVNRVLVTVNCTTAHTGSDKAREI